MRNKSIFKFVAAFGILAIMLIFLGVNFVPRISASQLNNLSSVNSVILS